MITKFKIFESLNTYTPTQVKLIHSPEFKNWFGDWEHNPSNSSKVVDNNGVPKIMFHGSDNMVNITVFKSTKGHEYNFFAADFYEATRYIKKETIKDKHSVRETYDRNKIKQFFINARKIYDPSNLYKNEEADAKKILKENDFIDHMLFHGYAKSNFEEFSFDLFDKKFEELNEEDKDNLLFYILTTSCDNWWLLETEYFQKYIKSNGYDAFTTLEGDGGNIAIYNPANIKLADGTNTTFDKNNPDIRK